MAGLGDTVFDLNSLRGLLKPAPASGGTALRAVTPSGSNPGQLAMHTCVPPGLPGGAPLVVVLHGCGQAAAGYDHAAGWSALAARHGFALLFPEQTRANNVNNCFNWFQPEDVTRGAGEALSIRQMIDQMVTTHRLNPARIYITGLSAGGAMTAAMLATYPDAFAGGAIIAGLPYGAAAGMPAAFEAMRNLRGRSGKSWGDLVRAASAGTSVWPTVQIWHGGDDDVVRPGAFEELVKQWSDVLAVDEPPLTEQVDGAIHRAWRARNSSDVVLEAYFVPGLGHGTPLHTQADNEDESVGAAAPFMLEAGISSTWRIARTWGLLTQASRPRTAKSAVSRDPLLGVAGVIKEALRAAGLKG